MEVTLKLLFDKIREGKITLSIFLADYLFVEGNITKEDYDSFCSNNSFIPNFITPKAPTNFEELKLDLDEKVNRELYIEFKRNNKEINLEFFT